MKIFSKFLLIFLVAILNHTFATNQEDTISINTKFSENEDSDNENNEKIEKETSNNQKKQELETSKETSIQKISRIEFKGCQRIDQETVASYLPVSIGDIYDDYAINESLKSLYSTGAYEEINFNIKNGVLIVKVKEYPIIEKISFEGNKKIKDSAIKEVIKLKSHEILSPTKVREIQQGLLEQYRKFGRYDAHVNPKIIKLNNNRVNLVFEINEGHSSGIRKINFVGNKKFSSNELRDVITSKIKRWYRFFVNDDIYDKDRLNQDKALLYRFYKEHGYADFNIISSTAELSTNKRGFIITFTVNEGEIYKLSDINVISHIKKLDANEFMKKLYCKKGNTYNVILVEADLSEINKKAGTKGFAAIKVIPEIKKDITKKTLGITYHILEGNKMYVSKIIIKGNSRTRDHVIRREIPLQEGDALNESLLSMAENNIRGLGFFKNVNVDVLPDENSPDKCIIQVNVDEQPTGEAMISVSYSTATSFSLGLSYNERNFFGSGKSLSVSLNSGFQNVSDSGIVYTESGLTKEEKRKKREFKLFNNVVIRGADPHLFDTDVEGSLTLHRNLSGRFYEFSTEELGGITGFSYELTPKITQSWNYSFNHRKYKDVIPFASPIIRQQVMENDSNGLPTKEIGKSILSSVKHGISYGTQILTGLKGYFRTGLNTTFAGLGGNTKHFKNEIFGVYVLPVLDKSTIKFGATGGLINKVGEKNPLIIDSFALGLDSFRGFDDCGLGPISETKWGIIKETFLENLKEINSYTTSAYIGAKKFWKGTVEFKFPIGLPEELQFRGFAFTDFGMVWDAPEKGEKFIKESKDKFRDDGSPMMVCDFDGNAYNIRNIKVLDHKIIDDKSIRASVGVGISFVTPLGPMIFTYAIPIKKNDKYDTEQRFLVGFSTTF